MGPQSAVLFADPLAEVKFLVDAAADGTSTQPSRTKAVIDVLADLRLRDAAQQQNLVDVGTIQPS